MGLDITVHRICKYDKETVDSYFFLDEKKEKFPLWVYDFESEKECTYYDWDKYKEQTGIDVKKLYWQSEEYSDKGAFLYLRYTRDPLSENIIKINLDEVPTYTKMDKIVGYNEVGYQRKGLNSKFYEDYRKGINKYFVFDKYTLERYKRDYCDTEEKKADFQCNIIDVFQEGKDVVSFDW